MITRHRRRRRQRIVEDDDSMEYEVDIPAQAVVNIVDSEDDEDTHTTQADSSLDSPDSDQKIDNSSTQTTPGLLRNGPPQHEEGGKEEDENDEDEDQACPICLEMWTNSGAHRLASLNCGHLFGRSCIQQWLREPRNRSCPQCKKPSKTRDIRNIYAKSLKALDTTERDQAKQKVLEESYKRSKAEEGEAKALLQCQMLKAEMERLKKEVEEQKRAASVNILDRKPKSSTTSSSSLNPLSGHWESQINSTQDSSSQSQRLSYFNKKYSLQKSLLVSQKGARVMAYDQQSMMMVVSKPSPNQLFAGYGLLKVSSLDSRSSEYFRIHQSTIRDAKFNHSGDQLVLTASIDKTLKLTNVLSNNIILSYTCPSPVWSCAWNRQDNNYIFAGLQNGACYMYDIRKLDEEICSMRPHVGVPCPIVSLSYISPPDSTSLLRCEGVLVGTIQGGWFMKKEDGTYTDLQMIFPEGSCAGISYEPLSNNCLLSQRPGKKSPRAAHLVCELAGDGTPKNPLRANVQKQCIGGNRAQSLTRSHLYPCPDDPSRLMVCAGDEASSSVMVWDGTRGEELQKLKSTGGTVFDVTTFNAYDSHFLATLTEQKLDLYQLK